MSAHSRGESREIPLPLPEPWKPTGKDTMLFLSKSGRYSFRCNVFKEVEQGVFQCNACTARYCQY
jgi:hypothetical protein